MKKNPLFLWALVLLCFGSSLWGGARLSSTQRLANDMLFFLASDDQWLTRDQIRHFLSRKGSASSLVYGRLIREREKALEEGAEITKKTRSKSDKILFKGHEVREAAIAELMALGHEAQGVLLSSIHSARQEVIMGVITALRSLDDQVVLPVLADVLERNKWGATPFTTRVRRHAIKSLGEMKGGDPRWEKMLSDALLDLDPVVRLLSREVLVDHKEHHEAFCEKGLQSSFAKELELYGENRLNAQSRGILDVFDSRDLEALNLLRATEALLSCGWLPKRSIPKEVLGKYDMLRLLLVHHSLLPVELRQRVIFNALKYPAGVLKLEAMQVLSDEDKDSFAVYVTPLLSIHEDPNVVMKALELSHAWELDIADQILKELSEKSRHKDIRRSAEELLGVL
jgi:HEAT repeat protein